MNPCHIYCLSNDEIAALEAYDKGYRWDIYVEIEKRFYHVHIYDIVRLEQSFRSEVQYYGFYDIQPNLILVEEVSHLKIIQTIEYLYGQGYFGHLKPVELSEEERQALVEF